MKKTMSSANSSYFTFAPRNIAIVGSVGTGKTTLAYKLAKKEMPQMVKDSLMEVQRQTRIISVQGSESSISLWDCPGWDSVHARNPVLPEADAYIVLLEMRGITRSDVDLCKTVQKSGKRFIVIYTQADRLNKGEIQDHSRWNKLILELVFLREKHPNFCIEGYLGVYFGAFAPDRLNLQNNYMNSCPQGRFIDIDQIWNWLLFDKVTSRL